MTVSDVVMVRAMTQKLERMGRAASTVSEYISDIEQFRLFMIERYGLKARLCDARSQDVVDWLAALGTKYKTNTVLKKRSSLKQLYTHAREMYEGTDPTVGLPFIARPIDLVRHVVPAETARSVREAVDLQDPRSVRDALMISLASELRLTSAQLIKLTCDDAAELMPRLCPDTATLLTYYLARTRSELLTRQSDRLFVSPRSDRMTRQRVWRNFRLKVSGSPRAVAYGATG